ncbi:MAG: hypothetical protein JSS24_07095 [Proteobacteria bacterium]|nr:hypothetical protein [Pseudomonadota bacterium]
MSRAVLLTAGLISYDLLCYYGTTRQAPALTTGLALAPAILIVTGLAWRARGRAGALIAALACASALWPLWQLLTRHFPLLLLAQQLSMWGVLFLMFARTLRAGRVPLCTEWADRLHGPLTSAERRYTRRVTLAWSLFFAGMGFIGALLFLIAPPHYWSAFNHLWALPLVALMFLGEYVVRHVALPTTAHAGLLAALRLYAARR